MKEGYFHRKSLHLKHLLLKLWINCCIFEVKIQPFNKEVVTIIVGVVKINSMKVIRSIEVGIAVIIIMEGVIANEAFGMFLEITVNHRRQYESVIYKILNFLISKKYNLPI